MRIVQYLKVGEDYHPAFEGQPAFQDRIEAVTRTRLQLRPEDIVEIHGILDDPECDNTPHVIVTLDSQTICDQSLKMIGLSCQFLNKNTFEIHLQSMQGPAAAVKEVP